MKILLFPFSIVFGIMSFIISCSVFNGYMIGISFMMFAFGIALCGTDEVKDTIIYDFGSEKVSSNKKKTSSGGIKIKW